ncbi:MAG TPA: PLD nuclease N-terminal domain-containing protein [Verrucomicrobiae bacterium]|nr:PLD nuclease N-terminal domain-containing protein [Verrucomicrobiae bacterium]
MGFGIPEIGIVIGIIGILVFEVVMFIDMVTSDRPVTAKIAWALAMLFLSPFASIFYFIAGRR